MKFITVLSLIFIFFSCKQKPNFDSLPTVSFASNIQPIIISNCTQSGCHGDSLTKQFKMLTYSQVIEYGRVNSLDPYNTKLYNVIKSLKDDVMPKKPFNQLTEKQIQLIYIWIGQGAKNN